MTAKQENSFYKKKLSLLEFMTRQLENTENSFEAIKLLTSFKRGYMAFTEVYKKLYNMIYN